MRKTLTFGIVSLLSIFVFVNCGDGTTEATANAPEVGTADVSDITATTAQCGGTVSSDGGAAVTARGVSWSTTQDPTISDYTTDDGVGVGSFTPRIVPERAMAVLCFSQQRRNLSQTLMAMFIRS